MNESVQIISTKEARRLLGKYSQKMSDEEVKDIILKLDFMAMQTIKEFKKSIDNTEVQS